MKRGFTCSSFDLLHAGHVLMLQEAKTVCDYLIVGLQIDPTVDRPSKNDPIQGINERTIQLDAIKYVDKIVIYNTEAELLILLKSYDIDIRIIGVEYEGKEFTGYDLDMEVYYNSRDHDYSTTALREQIYQREKLKHD